MKTEPKSIEALEKVSAIQSTHWEGVYWLSWVFVVLVVLYESYKIGVAIRDSGKRSAYRKDLVWFRILSCLLIVLGLEIAIDLSQFVFYMGLALVIWVMQYFYSLLLAYAPKD